MKEAKPKRVHTVSFHVYKVLEKAILNYSEKIQNSDFHPPRPRRVLEERKRACGNLLERSMRKRSEMMEMIYDVIKISATDVYEFVENLCLRHGNIQK